MAERSNAIRHSVIRHDAHRTNCTTAYISEIAMTEAPAGIPSSVWGAVHNPGGWMAERSNAIRHYAIRHGAYRINGPTASIS